MFDQIGRKIKDQVLKDEQKMDKKLDQIEEKTRSKSAMSNVPEQTTGSQKVKLTADSVKKKKNKDCAC